MFRNWLQWSIQILRKIIIIIIIIIINININFITENSMRYTLHQMVAATCDIKHKPPHYTPQEDRPNN